MQAKVYFKITVGPASQNITLKLYTNMSAKVFIFVWLIAVVSAKPTSEKDNKSEIEILLSKGLVGFVPVVLPLEEITASPQSIETEHHVQRRSAVRGENPSNDLLADYEGANYENSLTGLDRRIKTLPTWVG